MEVVEHGMFGLKLLLPYPNLIKAGSKIGEQNMKLRVANVFRAGNFF